MKHDEVSIRSCCSHQSVGSAILDNAHIDPVCGMIVATNPEKLVEHNGQKFYFCSQHCVTKFRADPNRYADKQNDAQSNAAIPSAAIPNEAVYTCPMHPEIRQIGPGTCPKCGMALEALLATTEEDTTELSDMTHRFWISLALTLPLLGVSMSELIPGLVLSNQLGMQAFNWLQAVLATPVVLWGGWPFFMRAWTSFKTWHLNMFSLIGLGTAAAYLFSLVALLFPAALPAAFKMDGMTPLYFEAAAVIITLVLLGQVLELRARLQTNSAIKSLLELAPHTAIRVHADGSEEEVHLDHIHVGDLLRIKPGAKIPVDGEMITGRSSIDESMITGESMPVEKAEGSKAIAGTVNQTGSFLLRAEKVGAQTLLSQIIQMVNEASRSRAPIQKLADRVSGWFVPAVMFIAIMAFIAWALIGPSPALAHALVAAVSVLIIACPCALGLATPISIMVGIGRGAKEGILIKDAQALELMEKVDTLVIDKTGTLTEGKPQVQSIVSTKDSGEMEVLAYAAALEKMSEHPLAHAIVTAAQERKLHLPSVENFQSITGQGIQGLIEGQTVIFGNAHMLQQQGIDISALQAQAQSLRSLGQTVMFLAIEYQLVGMISIVDPIKATTQEAISQLQKSNMHIVVLSGDNVTTATAVARQLGLSDVKADVLPQDKFRHIQALQQQGRIVAMAGDGINDAPALAQANVGIAMGTGTDVAMDSAHIVLVKGDLRGIVKARLLSLHTMKNIRQNLFFAFIYNFIGVPIAAGVLYPWLGILLSPMLASAAMSLSSVSVIGNALRLRRITI